MQLFLAATIFNKDHNAANTLDNFCRANKPMFRAHFSDGFSIDLFAYDVNYMQVAIFHTNHRLKKDKPF